MKFLALRLSEEFAMQPISCINSGIAITTVCSHLQFKKKVNSTVTTELFFERIPIEKIFGRIGNTNLLSFVCPVSSGRSLAALCSQALDKRYITKNAGTGA
jgi:hypothetical protein